MIAALAMFAILVVVLVAGVALRVVSQMAQRSESRLVGMVEQLHRQLASATSDAMHVLEETLKPPPPSPLEQERERQILEDVVRTQRFDDSDPFDGLVPPGERPTAAPLGDGDSPFGIPGLTVDGRLG